MSKALAVSVRDKVIACLVEAERALKGAVTIHRSKVVADVAAAQEVFARRQQLGEDIIGYVHAIKIHALARLGDLLQALPKATGGQPYQKRSTGTKAVPVGTLAELGLTKKVASVAQQLAALPPQTRDAIASREQTLASARRNKKAVELTKRLMLPDAKYRVIYANPPWAYMAHVVRHLIPDEGRAIREPPGRDHWRAP